MSALFKYAIVLASGLAIGLWISGPMSVERVAGLARIDETSIVVDNTPARLRPEEAASAVDPTAAIRVNEDLDYLIARRIGTLEGWQAFLAAHAIGDHVESATAEIDKLMLRVRASEPGAAEVSNHVSPEANMKDEIAALAPPSESAAHPVHEACNHDVDCPGNPRGALSGDDLTRIANESEPGEFRAEVAGLQDSSAMPSSSQKAHRNLGSKRRATSFGEGTTASSHIVVRRGQQRCAFRFGCHWNSQALPPILQALLNVKPKRLPRGYGQMIADASPGGSRGR